jgi:undecaprenyl diphosphate synthase
MAFGKPDLQPLASAPAGVQSPQHVAVIMDGNGRWASERGLPVLAGHRQGAKTLKQIVKDAVALDIEELTVYAFSTENWRRPAEEVRFLLNVISDQLLLRRRDQLNEMGVRIRFIGRRDWRVPKRVLHRMDESVEMTKHNRRMTFTVAFNYGGRAEIVDAVKALINEGVPARKVDIRAIKSHMYAPDMPDPDLVIRTSGEFRLSNFLIWEVAYSELVFTDVLWPDFRRVHLAEAIREFQRRDRRFGGRPGSRRDSEDGPSDLTP